MLRLEQVLKGIDEYACRVVDLLSRTNEQEMPFGLRSSLSDIQSANHTILMSIKIPPRVQAIICELRILAVHRIVLQNRPDATSYTDLRTNEIRSHVLFIIIARWFKDELNQHPQWRLVPRSPDFYCVYGVPWQLHVVSKEAG